VCKLNVSVVSECDPCTKCTQSSVDVRRRVWVCGVVAERELACTKSTDGPKFMGRREATTSDCRRNVEIFLIPIVDLTTLSHWLMQVHQLATVSTCDLLAKSGVRAIRGDTRGEEDDEGRGCRCEFRVGFKFKMRPHGFEASSRGRCGHRRTTVPSFTASRPNKISIWRSSDRQPCGEEEDDEAREA
jgi:hypothetical protein